MRKENKGLILNVGTPSILLILLVFVMAVFGMLSVRASGSECALAQKTGDSVQEYYKADQKAEYVLAYVDSVLSKGEIDQLQKSLQKKELPDRIAGSVEKIQTNLKKGAVMGEAENIGTVFYTVPVRKDVSLEVELDLYGDKTYRIRSWKMSEGVWEGDAFGTTVELWDGDTGQ